MGEKPVIYLYNTMSRSKEAFTPADGDTVRAYSCGPTVYDAATIGNLRAYIFVDCLRRVLKYGGYKLLHVMNITDVGHLVSDEDTGEDKILKGAREKDMSPWDVAKEYTDLFMNDTAALNIGMPEIVCKATDHIPQMLEMVETLVDRGFGYEISDGIYFDISKFNEYGRLSRMDLDEQMAGARIGVNPEKRHPADFALWIKAPKEHIMKWDSRWGDGYPGWHIECSAMSIHYLGDKIDIHTGGIDHIPIHHENEIAQSDAYSGKNVVKTWMHNEFLLIDNGKMSKSLKNAYTVADLQAKGYNPLVYRYFCLNGHYRNKLNFTWDGLHAASVSYRRFIDGAKAHACAAQNNAVGMEADGASQNGVLNNGAGTDVDDAYIDEMTEAFDAAVFDDLNIPKALGVAWQLIRHPVKSHKIYELLIKMDGVLGLGLAEAASIVSGGILADGVSDAGEVNAGGGSGSPGISQARPPVDIPDDIAALVNERDTARANKDWKRSDELRDEIKEKGFNLLDSKQGTKIERIISHN